MKRLLDISISLFGLVLTSPVLVPSMLAVWLQDRHSPFYVAPRVGRKGKIFHMVKMRSMVVRADHTGVDSTSVNDPRITVVGRFIRRYKLDELTQLWNVLKGDMSLVGPRPQVERDVALYTCEEKKLLTVPPGITDIASIVFSDEGEILKGSQDPDLTYNQVIRPYKSRFALIYVDNQSVKLDIMLIYLTILSIVSRDRALVGIKKILDELGANERLKQVAVRQGNLQPYPPPGAKKVVMQRSS